MTSAFAAAGPRLREMNLSVLPILPGGKAPGKYASGQWWPAHDWQQYGTRLPSRFEMEIWPRWPDAGIGLALGESSAPPGLRLVAMDVDTDDAIISKAILSALPASPVRKKGRTGQTAFYLAPPSIDNAAYNDTNKKRVLDVLCSGRQTILPPTLHANTGQPYVWLTPDTLENFSVADLPVLPDDVIERLDAALAPFEISRTQRITHAAPGEGAAGDATLAADSIHRSLNDAALANLAAWVPALQLYGCRDVGGRYKAVASWRSSSSGRPLSQRATNLVISPDGIKDKGAEQGYTPLDLVMAATGADLDTAFRFLQERVAPQAPIILTAKAPTEEIKRGNLAGLLDPTVAPYVGDVVVPIRPDIAVPAQPAVPAPAYQQAEVPADGTIPDDMCAPPGLLGDVVNYIIDTASMPIPQHALASALVFVGTIMGRRWESPTRARTNFYAMALAGSGSGKDHPMKAARALTFALGLEKFMGAEDAKSDSAIRKLLERFPVAGLYMDEFGGYFKKILDRRAAAHDKRQRDMILTLFSRANDYYLGSEGATEKAVPIINPHLCMFGASTPEDLWAAFSSASTSDGLLARFLVFNGDSDEDDWVEPKISLTDPPHALRRKVIDLLEVRPKGNLNGVGGNQNRPIMAEWGDGAFDWWTAYRREKSAMANANVMRKPVYKRAAEHVNKLALVVAVGCDPQQPVITVSGLEWARMVVECSMTALFAAMEDRIADSDHQQNYLWVKRMIFEAGRFGISQIDLRKAVNGRFEKRKLDEIIAQLTEAGEIGSDLGSGPKGGRPTARWFKVYRDEEAALGRLPSTRAEAPSP